MYNIYIQVWRARLMSLSEAQCVNDNKMNVNNICLVPSIAPLIK